MTKDKSFSPKRVEEAARTADVISRANAANPVQGGKDRLDQVPGRAGTLGRDFL